MVCLVLLALRWGSVWQHATEARVYRDDLGSYCGAAAVAWEGGDPYAGSVPPYPGVKTHTPFLYPSVFLLPFRWAVSRPPSDAVYGPWFLAGRLAFLAAMMATWRWLGVRWWVPALLVLGFWPESNDAHFGQVNSFVLLLVVLGLALERGELIAAAILTKIFPIVLVPWLLLRGRFRMWRQLLWGGGALLLLTRLVLPGTLSRYWLEVFPGLLRGDYNGLDLPLRMTSNQSLVAALDYLWPSVDGVLPSTEAALAARAVLVVLGLVTLVVTATRRGETQGTLCAGAWVCLAVVAPARAWDHHFVLMAFPAALVLHQAWLRPGWRPRALALAAVGAMAAPRSVLQAVLAVAPELDLPVGRARLFGALVVWGFCVAYAWRGHGEAGRAR